MTIKLLAPARFGGAEYTGVVTLDQAVEDMLVEQRRATRITPGTPPIAIIGDSITQQQSADGYRTTPDSISPTNIGAALVMRRAQRNCPTGDGTLRYFATHVSGKGGLSWQPNGLVEGPRLPVTTDGIFVVPGPAPMTGLEVGIRSDWFGTSDQSDTINVTASGYDNIKMSTGWLGWALALSGQRCEFIGNWGSSGCHARHCIGAADQLLAAMPGPGIVVYHAGTNDANSNRSAAQIVSDSMGVVDKLLNAGHAVVVVNLMPRSDSAWTGGSPSQAVKNRHKAEANVRLADAVRRRNRCYLVDAHDLIVDRASATDSPRTNALWDNLHLGTFGGYLVGQRIAAVLQTLVPGNGLALPSYASTYDATDNPLGNLITTAGMGVMNGSGGTAGTGASGTIAAGWRVQRTTGAAITATCSKVARTDGVTGEWQRIVLASAAAAYEVIDIDIASGVLPGFGSNFSVGDVIRAVAQIKVTNAQVLREVSLALAPTGVSGNFVHADLAYSSTSSTQIPNGESCDLTLRTPDFVIPSIGMTGINFRIRLATGIGGAATIDIASALAHKVP